MHRIRRGRAVVELKMAKSHRSDLPTSAHGKAGVIYLFFFRQSLFASTERDSMEPPERDWKKTLL